MSAIAIAATAAAGAAPRAGLFNRAREALGEMWEAVLSLPVRSPVSAERDVSPESLRFPFP